MLECRPGSFKTEAQGRETKSIPRMAECQDFKMHYLKIPTILQSCTRELHYLDNMGITFLGSSRIRVKVGEYFTEGFETFKKSNC